MFESKKCRKRNFQWDLEFLIPSFSTMMPNCQLVFFSISNHSVSKFLNHNRLAQIDHVHSTERLVEFHLLKSNHQKYRNWQCNCWIHNIVFLLVSLLSLTDDDLIMRVVKKDVKYFLPKRYRYDLLFGADFLWQSARAVPRVVYARNGTNFYISSSFFSSDPRFAWEFETEFCSSHQYIN